MKILKTKRKPKAERAGWEALKRKLADERPCEGRSMCTALGINPFKVNLLGRWGRLVHHVLKRKGAKDKQMITLTVIKSCYLPDGTEKFPDLRVSLNAGSTYSIPVSVAKVLFKKGLAVRRETTKI